MVGGRPVGEGDVGARQQEPGEIDTGAPTLDDEWFCSLAARCGVRSSEALACHS